MNLQIIKDRIKNRRNRFSIKTEVDLRPVGLAIFLESGKVKS